jgi:son of sevenless-like protein
MGSQAIALPIVLDNNSDGSDFDPSELYGQTPPPSSSLQPAHPTPSTPFPSHHTTQLTQEERFAQSLQQALTPPPPETLNDLSKAARDAITVAIDFIRGGRLHQTTDDEGNLDDSVDALVAATRNLLHVCAPPAGRIPDLSIPQEARGLGLNITPQASLKPSLRKVIATLSKFILSARQIQFETEPFTSVARHRIETEAEALDRAVEVFAFEVQQIHSLSFADHPDGPPLRRSHGVFSPSHIGLVGAGAAGSWKGFGWVALDQNEERPCRVPGINLILEFERHLRHAEEQFGCFAQAVDRDSCKRL